MATMVIMVTMVAMVGEHRGSHRRHLHHHVTMSSCRILVGICQARSEVRLATHDGGILDFAFSGDGRLRYDITDRLAVSPLFGI